MKLSAKRMMALMMVMAILFALAACNSSSGQQSSGTTTADEAEKSPSSASEQQQASSSDYPSDTVTIVVCHSAGGGTDVAARILAPYLAEELGVNVVVENVTGGNGITGHLDVLNRGNEGYAIATSNCISFIVAPMMYDEPYDAAKDFTAICATGNSSIFLAAGPDAPADDLDGLIAYAKENPGAVTISCAGLGDISGISAARSLRALGIECTLVPYESAAESASACAGGHVMYAASTNAGIAGFVEEETLSVILDLTGGVDKPAFDVPSIVDITGNEDDATVFYRTMVVPASTPDDIVDILRKAFMNVMSNPDLQAEYEALGDQVTGVMDGATMQAQVEADSVVYAELVEEMGLREG